MGTYKIAAKNPGMDRQPGDRQQTGGQHGGGQQGGRDNDDVNQGGGKGGQR
jgi:hypothetical protein